MVKNGYNGLLADVNNSDDLAAKIDVVLSDDKLRKEMGERSRLRLLEKFSYDSYVKNFSETYEGLVRD